MFRKTNIGFALLLSAAFLIAGCNSNIPVTQAITSSPDIAAPQEAAVLSPDTNNVPLSQKTMQITTYQATEDALSLVPESHIVPENNHPAQTALELLVAGTNNPKLISIVPAGTQIRDVKIKNHIAYADFDDTIIKNNPGGSTSEMLLVAAIVDTLTEFPEIEKVQILINGKKVDTITGHLDTSEPLSRSEQLLKKQ